MKIENINREIKKCKEILNFKNLKDIERFCINKYLESLYQNRVGFK